MQNQEDKIFQINKIYLKNLSFESPKSPEISLNLISTPSLHSDFEIKAQKIDIKNTEGNKEQYKSLYEISLHVTVTAHIEEGQVLYLAEVQQAGIFEMTHLNEEEVKVACTVHCPEILYPFARQEINKIITSGGFPAVLLPPFNFSTLQQNNKTNTKMDIDNT